MKNAKSPIDKTRKQGTLLIDDKMKHRKTEVDAAAYAKQRNKGKVHIRKDDRTVLLVDQSKVDKVMIDIRIAQVNHPKNAKKKEYLEELDWQLRADGLWQYHMYYTLEFEAALQLAGYYEWLKKQI